MHVGGAFWETPQAILPMGERGCTGASNWPTAGLTRRNVSTGPVF